MTLKLTKDQCQAIEERGGEPVYLIDADTNISYVLMRAEQFEKVRVLLDESIDPREVYPFVDRVMRIVCVDAANALRAAAASFGMDRPELDRGARNAYMDTHHDAGTFGVRGWNDCICGESEVWKALAAWARTHSGASH